MHRNRIQTEQVACIINEIYDKFGRILDSKPNLSPSESGHSLYGYDDKAEAVPTAIVLLYKQYTTRVVLYIRP